MKTFFNKIIFRSNNLNLISKSIKDLTKKTPSNKIFDAINSYSSESEIRFVGGCIRKIIKNEKVNDIDLATNLLPNQVCEILKKNDIDFFESGIEHGTITALIDEYKFEITTLRKDILTDGRHAKVQFSKDWREDASRRDFTINSIYSDGEGNLFDPYNGKKDLENGSINFIGDTDKRIKEDYLRILRYLRFFLEYSKQSHDLEVIKKLKTNIGGIKKLSKERLYDELKKLIKINMLEKLSKDNLSSEIFLMIFPELKNISKFSRLGSNIKEILKKNDFIFLLSLLIIDGKDNADYFLYKFNVSKKDQKRIKIIDNFFKEKINSKTFTENKINRLFYYNGKQAVLDIINYRIICAKKIDLTLVELYKEYESKLIPVIPVSADLLIKKHKIPQGKLLGETLKKIEDKWIQNNFKISDKDLENIIDN